MLFKKIVGRVLLLIRKIVRRVLKLFDEIEGASEKAIFKELRAGAEAVLRVRKPGPGGFSEKMWND